MPVLKYEQEELISVLLADFLSRIDTLKNMEPGKLPWTGLQDNQEILQGSPSNHSALHSAGVLVRIILLSA